MAHCALLIILARLFSAARALRQPRRGGQSPVAGPRGLGIPCGGGPRFPVLILSRSSPAPRAEENWALDAPSEGPSYVSRRGGKMARESRTRGGAREKKRSEGADFLV